MKKNEVNSEINLVELIFLVFKEKILILTISLAFIITGFLYGQTRIKDYQTVVTIQKAPSIVFIDYDIQKLFRINSNNETIQLKDQLASQFNFLFLNNLQSLDTLVGFTEQNKNISEFKNYLKANKVNIRDYLTNKLKPSKLKKTNVTNPIGVQSFSFEFNQPLKGNKFLDNYVNYVKQKTEIDFQKQLSIMIKNEINLLELNLNIAEKINLDNPILKERIFPKLGLSDYLYYEGSKVLNTNIEYLNKILKKIENINLDYDPIIEKSSSPILLTKSKIFYSFVFFLIGLFLSIIIINFKLYLHKKKI